jgi:ArsR family transcriptional regulator, arsenate/arsenite/antimonite-responsive transcriptional repressor
VLKIVSDTNRLQLLCLLKQGTHCVCDLMEHLSLSQSLVSHHLQDLKLAGLVAGEKKGKWVHYALTDEGKRITELLFTITPKE